MRITILFGGSNRERLVSVASAQALHQALPEAELWWWDVEDKVHVVQSKQLLEHSRPFEDEFKPGTRGIPLVQALDQAKAEDRVLVLGLHGGRAENGELQVTCEARGVGRDGAKHVFSNADMKFVYRNSGVDPSIIFTSAQFRGEIRDTDAIRARMAEVQTHRETAQPIREKTGGSTFKNPPGHSAWKLVDAAGCRGLRVGGAQVSEMHCNFLINTGEATAHDIETLGETVRERVKANSGIELHWEIKRIGVSA